MSCITLRSNTSVSYAWRLPSGRWLCEEEHDMGMGGYVVPTTNYIDCAKTFESKKIAQFHKPNYPLVHLKLCKVTLTINEVEEEDIEVSL